MIMTAQEMLDQAIVELGNLNDGDVFIVKDLFKGHLWNAQDRSERLALGTLFMNFAKQNRSTIEVLNKNSSGQQEYKKVEGWSFKPLSKKNFFLETGVMEVKTTETGMICIIGTSWPNRQEMYLKSSANVEKLASVLNLLLTD